MFVCASTASIFYRQLSSAAMQGVQVYHEAQVAGLCGVHCLNTLLQGPYFTEIDLMSIAHEFDKKEKEVMSEAGTETKDFIKFIAVFPFY
jgi:hypothetical protein